MTDRCIRPDTAPIVMTKGSTNLLQWYVVLGSAPIDAPWQARGEVRVSESDPTSLETFTLTVQDGFVRYVFESNHAFAWDSGWLGIKIHDDTQSPPEEHEIVRCPVTVRPELVA